MTLSIIIIISEITIHFFFSNLLLRDSTKKDSKRCFRLLIHR